MSLSDKLIYGLGYIGALLLIDFQLSLKEQYITEDFNKDGIVDRRVYSSPGVFQSGGKLKRIEFGFPNRNFYSIDKMKNRIELYEMMKTSVHKSWYRSSIKDMTEEYEMLKKVNIDCLTAVEHNIRISDTAVIKED